jgi:hypothetical protein
MTPITDPTTNALTGLLSLILELAAVIAFLLSIVLLKLYRRAVLRTMRKSDSRRVTDPESPTIPHQSRQTVLGLTVLDQRSTITVKPHISDVLRAPWRAAAIYAIAGFCYALIIATAWLSAQKLEIFPFRLLFMLWTFAWPVVLTTNLVASSTRRKRVAVTAVYFLSLAFLGSIDIALRPL